MKGWNRKNNIFISYVCYVRFSSLFIIVNLIIQHSIITLLLIINNTLISYQ